MFKEIQWGGQYSTDERIIGVWIDGKPVYQKTFTIPVTSASIDYQHNISNIDNVVYSYAVWKDTNNGFTPLSFANASNIKWSVGFAITTSIFEIRIGSSHTNLDGNIYATIQYTKTTD